MLDFLQARVLSFSPHACSVVGGTRPGGPAGANNPCARVCASLLQNAAPPAGSDAATEADRVIACIDPDFMFLRPVPCAVFDMPVSSGR